MDTFSISFESKNYDIHCARGVNEQIIKYVNIQHHVSMLESSLYEHCTDVVKMFCEEMDKTKTKNCTKLTNMTYGTGG